MSQKIGAKSQAINSFAAYDLHKITGEMKVMIKKDLSEIMRIRDQRRYAKLGKTFR
jgi:hypothetical protein